ncbi:autotransporter outer membrane beta-barrel domain-containing protein [uncultured Phascolarctobacterium sp.]|uniref:autotransporter outer membrane beta-barrel domain-containing protein n=1 Tax=uncultured Phascolarctobacterium sp. TaxID=512296 RepID=UPI0025E6D84E|nr:autotransporter outer membrane beta-barrel domain-containing protein [uncultured Phascolarctobacterium sp.]
MHSSGGTINLTAGSISVQATGGKGGTGGEGGEGGEGGDGGRGGMGGSAGQNVGGTKAQNGKADKGGDGGKGGTGGDGGKGGQGGSAIAYGVHSSGGTINLTVDSISVKASGGASGSGGTGGTAGKGGSGGKGGINPDDFSFASDGTDGTGGSDGNSGSAGNTKGEQAEAYGIYVEQGAVITLRAQNTGGTIAISANAEEAQNMKAYAIYADTATVLFNDTATLNTSDGTNEDNAVITYLKDATLGFGSPGAGQDVGRTITGGTLQLEGSNTFRVATDLTHNRADSFEFKSLAADSSTETQYITVGYDKAFDGSRLGSFIGAVTVLTIKELNSQKLNFAGKESELDDPLSRFLATPTVEVDGNDVKITQIDFRELGVSEAVMTAADAQMSIENLWRIEGNNLMKRLGDLRSDPKAAEGGVWARYYRGEMNADSAYDRSFDQDYTAFQGGIDKVQDYKGSKLYTGIAVNRIDSNASYNSGSGDLSSTGVGVYASWLGSKGHYLDVIARGSKLTNDFKLVDLSGNAAKADYDTWAYGISAEYGYRQDLQGGWFIEPQAELSLGRIGSNDYTMTNGTQISQEAVNSAVTRIGVLSGKEFTMNGRQSNAYLKASLLHDFGGSGSGEAYYDGRSVVMDRAEMNGTWWELGLGANLGIAKNSNLYFDALKTFGGDLRTEWQFNAGLRFTF